MLLSDKKQKQRLDICNGCEFKRNDFKLFNVILWKRKAQCKVCKCFLDAKTKIDFASCPKGKW
jgi:hypothetical protein